MKFKKFMPIFLIIVVFFFIYKNKKDTENFASTSNGTLLQLRAKGNQDSVLTSNHSFYDASRGYRFRSYPRNDYNSNQVMNTHVLFPGGYFPLNKYAVTVPENSW